MLQLGQYGQAGLNPASFSLRDAIEAVLSDLDSPAGVSVEIPERFEVYADLVLIREVIANLVGNAVKYSRTRAEPDIVIGASRQGGEVLVWVRDNGVGFPVEEAHRLFKSFERLHPAQEFEGAGIGLAIVKRVVERHGGRVWARAFEGQGAEFGFGLPQDHQ
jgi:signal transduction histidine kinase